MTHVNVNFFRNKFGMLTNIVTEYKDKLIISESNLDDTFLKVSYII